MPFSIFQYTSGYYFLILILQAYCVYHSYKRGTHSKWMWIIVFLPLIGCMVYLFSEVIQKKDINTIQSGVGQIINPGGRIKELEKRFHFSDTFANRCALADAYLEAGLNEKAIELYEPALTGIFSDNEQVIKQLALAYYNTGRFQDVINIVPRIVNSLDFSKTQACLVYARSLEQCGKYKEAEDQYQAMNHRFSNYEARYYYAMFLLAQNKTTEGMLILHEITAEADRLSVREKGKERAWINKAREEMKTRV